MRLVVLTLLALVACDPPGAPEPASSPGPARAAPAHAAAPTNVDVRVEFEQGPDPDYGEVATSVRAVLVVRALGLRKKLFTVPAPYTCARGQVDAGDALVVRCTGSEDSASALVRIEPQTIVVVARDYGHIALQRTHDEIPLPPNATATVFAPTRFPASPR